MNSNKKKRSLQILLFISVILGLLYLLGWLKPFQNLLEPFVNGIKHQSYVITSNINDINQTITRLGEYKNRNEELIAENLLLTEKIADTLKLNQEISNLKEQLGITNKEKFKYIETNVIDLSNFTNPEYITIDIGSNSVVQKGDIVVKGQYVIGEVTEVFQNSSTVELISSPNSTISVETINGQAKGILKKDNKNNMVMTLILPEENILKDDLVFTSGIKSNFPKGFIVGKVKEVKLSSNNFNKEAIIEQLLDFSNLSGIFLIKKQ